MDRSTTTHAYLSLDEQLWCPLIRREDRDGKVLRYVAYGVFDWVPARNLTLARAAHERAVAAFGPCSVTIESGRAAKEAWEDALAPKVREVAKQLTTTERGS